MDTEKMDALAGSLAELDDELTPRTPEQREAEEAAAKAADPENQAKAWGVLAFSIGGMLSVLAPELKNVYTEDACLAWGHSVVPVAEKYGWDGPSNVPELGLLLATVPLALPTYFIVRKRLAELRAAKAAADEARTVDNQAEQPGGAS